MAEAVVEDADGRVRLRAGAMARGAAMYEALRATPSVAWPVLGAAGIPTLLILATEPAEARRRPSASCRTSSPPSRMRT